MNQPRAIEDRIVELRDVLNDVHKRSEECDKR